MTSLNILSGGAAQELVRSLAPMFKEQTGFDIDGEFGAVGAMAERLRRGTAADIVILTAAIMTKLIEEGLIVRSSISELGTVETALAVRTRDPKTSIKDASGLREALLASDAIFLPDTTASTAGMHVAKIFEQLGIANQVAARLNIFPNGATAMRHLADSGARRPIGCTQSTEIIGTEGVMLSGSLPPGCELATVYTAGVTTHAGFSLQAEQLIGLLTAADQKQLRYEAGFRDVKEYRD